MLATLPGPYDVAFIDADKDNYPNYRGLHSASAAGRDMIADNAIRRGRIVDAGVSADIDGIRAMHDLLADDPGLIATTVPVGDGVAIAVKRSDHRPLRATHDQCRRR